MIRVNETVLKGFPVGISGGLGLLVLSLLLKESSSLLVSFLIILLLGSSSLLVEGIQSLHDHVVLQWVSLGLLVGELVLSDSSQLKLDLVRVDNSGQISASHQVSVKDISSFLDSLYSVASENVVKLSKGIFGPDDKSSQMTTWSKLQKIQSVNVASVDSWEISGSSLNEVVLVSIDNKRSLSHDISGVSDFSVSDSNLSRISGSLQLISNSELLECSEESLGGFNIQAVNDQGEFGNVLDSVSSGEDKGSHSGGSQS